MTIQKNETKNNERINEKLIKLTIDARLTLSSGLKDLLIVPDIHNLCEG